MQINLLNLTLEETMNPRINKENPCYMRGIILMMKTISKVIGL